MKGLCCNFNYPVTLSGNLANNSTAAEKNLPSFFHEVNWDDVLDDYKQIYIQRAL
jgi:hypothetical protein